MAKTSTNRTGPSKVLKKFLDGKTHRFKLDKETLSIKFAGEEKLFLNGKQTTALKFFVLSNDKKAIWFYVKSNKNLDKIEFIGFKSVSEVKNPSKNKVVIFKLKNMSGAEFDKIFLVSIKKGFPKISSMNESLSESRRRSEYDLDKYYYNDKKQNFFKKVFNKSNIENFYLLASVFTTLLVLVIWMVVFRKLIATVYAETMADKAFKEMMNKLFKNQTKMYEFFTEYSDLINGILNLINSKTVNGLLIYGRPGTGKTFMVIRTLFFENVKFKIEKGGVKTLFEFGKLLYRYRSGYVIVLDDFDSAFNDPDMVNILKTVTDTYEKRIVSIPFASKTDSSALTVKPVPEKFIFKSKVIVITNKERDEIPKALLSRMIGIHIDFTDDKIIKMFNKYIDILAPDTSKEDKLDVIKYIKELRESCKIPVDFRLFNSLIEIKKLYKNKWKEVARNIYCGNK